jgi:hypothetical protein
MKTNIDFFIIYRSIPLEWEMFYTKSCRENQNTHFVFNNFFPYNSAVYEITWKNTVETDRWQYGACGLHAWYLRLQTHTHNM